MKITILAYNAHRSCAEGVARIHYNLYSALKRIEVEVNLLSIIDLHFERTFTFDNSCVKDARHEFYIISNNNKASSETLLIPSSSLIDESSIIINGLSSIKIGVYLRLLNVLGFKKWKFVESLFFRPFRFFDRCKYLLPFTFKIFVYSPSEYKYLCKILPFTRSKISLIPPPIDTDHFVKKDKRRSLSMLGLDDLEDKILIGYFGNPFPDRLPISETFKALAGLAPKHDIVFVGVFPPYKRRTFLNAIYKIARSFNLEKRVLLIEKFIDYSIRPFLYSSFDVLLHLYKWKEAPYPFLTVLEAFSVETPVITTNYNEIRWALRNLDYPLFIDLTSGVNALSIKSALEKFLNLRNTEEMETMLSSIRARIIRLFSLESVGRRTLKELKGVGCHDE
ncbi:MAG: glycosyltransferase [Candidatus Bathyarchaeia archaeon]